MGSFAEPSAAPSASRRHSVPARRVTSARSSANATTDVRSFAERTESGGSRSDESTVRVPGPRGKTNRPVGSVPEPPPPPPPRASRTSGAAPSNHRAPHAVASSARASVSRVCFGAPGTRRRSDSNPRARASTAPSPPRRRIDATSPPTPPPPPRATRRNASPRRTAKAKATAATDASPSPRHRQAHPGRRRHRERFRGGGETVPPNDPSRSGRRARRGTRSRRGVGRSRFPFAPRFDPRTPRLVRDGAVFLDDDSVAELSRARSRRRKEPAAVGG